jgi:hypothetical protein
MDERDRFLARLKGDMDGKAKQAWSGPSIEHREAFLRGMQSLTDRISSHVEETGNTPPQEEEDIEAGHPDEEKLRTMMEQGDLQAAFFLARRLLANGEDWAQAWLDRIQSDWKATP